jgi:nucleoredoxin
MSEYKMPWPAIRFDAAKSIPAVQRFSGNGIPNLVFVTADGEILSSSYVDGKYVGPRKGTSRNAVGRG